jgi:hypothetical protein
LEGDENRPPLLSCSTSDTCAATRIRGYNFRLGKLLEHQGNFVKAEMVKAFITSGEYRQRFGQ